MTDIRRSAIKLGDDLGLDFANTGPTPDNPTGSLRSWGDLVDFVELRGGVSRAEGADLRAMGERDARRSAAALDEALRFREVAQIMLGAMASRRPLQARWIGAVNRALASGTGANRLVRQEAGWRLTFAPAHDDPLRVLAPIARSLADLAALGRGAEIRKCAHPRCVLYFRDRSRTRRRRWCSMAVCGNRMKVAAHARRHGRRRRRS